MTPISWQLQFHHWYSSFSPILLQPAPSCLAGGIQDSLRLFPDPEFKAAVLSWDALACSLSITATEPSISQFQKHLSSQAALWPAVYCPSLNYPATPAHLLLVRGGSPFSFEKTQRCELVKQSPSIVLPTPGSIISQEEKTLHVPLQ